MLVEIFISGQQLDTYPGTSIAQTLQVNDFFELSARQTSYTNSFSVPKTELNKKLLGGMSIIGNTSLAPYRIQNFNVFKDGIQVIANGTGYVRDGGDSFELNIYHDNINLFDVIGDTSLADLPLESLNHNLNINTWLDSFNRNDYTYALADYGKTDADAIEINYQIPSVFVKYLWDAIFRESGFTYKYSGRGNRNDFNPFNTDQWKELAITINEGLPTNDESVEPIDKVKVSKIQTSEFEAESVDIFGRRFFTSVLPSTITEYVRFGVQFNPDGIHSFNGGSDNRSRLVIQEDGFYRLRITGALNRIQTDLLSVFIEKRNVNLFTVKEDAPQGQSQIGFDQRSYLRAGDVLYFKVVSSPKDNQSYYSYELNLDLQLDNSVTAVNFSSYFSKIKKKDFIKEACNFFGLMFRRKDKMYEFIAYEELLDPLTNYKAIGSQPSGVLDPESVYEDWSDKFDRLMSTEFQIGEYGQSNRMIYKYDDPEADFANGSIPIDDQTIDSDKTIVQSLFNAPERSTVRVNGIALRKCNLYEREFNDDGSLKSVKPKKGTSYFHRIQRQQLTISYKLSNSEGSNTVTRTVPVMSFDGLDFNSVISTRYTAMARTLNFAQKHSALLSLNVIDIHKMDFFKLKYIKQLGGLFYLNKIAQYTGNGSTKVELIKIRSIEKLGEFSDDFSDQFNN